jgi:hypothetical protein
MGSTIKIVVFWNVTPRSLVDVYRYFIGIHSTPPSSVYCEYGGSMFHKKVSKYLQDYMMHIPGDIYHHHHRRRRHRHHHLQVLVLLDCSDFKICNGISPAISSVKAGED